ncbi:helix-turn-helix transcriptional regulator [Bacillus sp. S13(2024)]|uniref:helix-turn-helix transcriptional regulator n=1 Tax=Bacillus sp. S13(2024) TaxID=3162885 RepID=UPI003D1C441D
MEFKCRLKIIFAEMDIKQGDFAKQIGIDDSTLSAIVRNRTKPRFDTAYLICKELGKRIEEVWILDEENEKSP